MKSRSSCLPVLGMVLTTMLLAGCGGDGGGPAAPPPPGPTATIVVSPNGGTIAVGGSLQLQALLNDASGATTNRPVTWTSSNTSIASVTQSGLVTGVGAGTATITAASDGKTASVSVTVSPPPVATVTIAPPSGSVIVGGTLQLTAVLRDVSGNTLAGRAVNWSSSNAAVATVDNAGLVRGTGAGSATITATSEGVNGTAAVTVVGGNTPGGPTITSISPDPMVEGASATIQGTGFGATVASNQVTVDGVSATVTAASATSLTITVPDTGCRPTRAVDLRITVNGGAGQVTGRPTVRPAAFLSVASGQQVMQAPSSSGNVCLQFNSATASEAYIIGVQSISEVPTSLTPVLVTGVVPATTNTISQPLSFASPLMLTQSPASLERSARWRRHRVASARELQRTLADLRPGIAESGELTTQSATIPSTVRAGDTVSVKVPTFGNSCSGFTSITAVVRANGTRGIWVEDVANPAVGGFTAADFQTLSNVFDSDIYTTDTEYFGVPSDRDQNNRVVIVVTKELNKVGDILGGVFSADLVNTTCPSSNVGEFYYGVAPDSSGEYALGRYPAADARLDAQLLIAHEFTHIIQFSRRAAFPGARGFQSIWELEGQATLAEEVVGHKLTGRSVAQNYGFEVAFNEPVTSDVDWYVSIFVDLALYYGFASATANVGNAPESCTWLGQQGPGNEGPCIGDRQIYGVAAFFLRWLSDQFGPTYPGGEKAMHRAFIDNTQVGFATISSVVGRPIDELLTQWAAALYVDDRVSGVAPRLTITSWNLFNIWARIRPTGHLTPRERSFSAFSDPINVRAGSAAYFRVSGANHSAAAINVTGTGSAPLPATIRVWVVKAQ